MQMKSSWQIIKRGEMIFLVKLEKFDDSWDIDAYEASTVWNYFHVT